MKHQTEIYASPGNKILAVDYLKGFSIFTIALMHLLDRMSAVPGIIHTFSAIGGTGVHVFFVCSGIGLYTSYIKHKTSYIEFIKKRFFKIYIPYIVVVFVSFFCPWLYYGDSRVTALLSHVFLFKMFSPMYESSFGAPFWFISTLFQLYALFIPMCRIKAKLNNNKIFMCLFGGISIFWWIICYWLGIGGIRIWGSFCLQYIWEFALGFILADLFFVGKKYILNNYLLFASAVLGIGIQSFLALTSDMLKVFNDVPALVGYASLALLFSNIPVIKKLCHKMSVFSFEFYLLHNLFFVTVFHWMVPVGIFLQCVVGIVAMGIALGGAYLFNKIINSISNYKVSISNPSCK